mgnify:CR=1 FL=1
MNKKEVIELIGKETVLKFSFCHDGCFYFETLVPIISDDEEMFVYGVEVYTDEQSNDIFHDFNTLDDIVRENQLAEVRKHYRADGSGKTIYFETYKQLNK